MPRFTGQNKKRIDPRYFLNETVEEGVLDFLKSPTQKRRGDAKKFFNSKPGTLRGLILDWIRAALPDTDVKGYHSRDDKYAGSDFAEVLLRDIVLEVLVCCSFKNSNKVFLS